MDWMLRGRSPDVCAVENCGIGVPTSATITP